MLRKFAAFPEIQVIDLDAAIGNGENSELVELLASRSPLPRRRRRPHCRARPPPHRSRRASRHRRHRGVHARDGSISRPSVGPERIIIALDSKGGKIIVKGWRESTDFTAEEVIGRFEPFCSGFLCTYVDKEGMLQGTDLDWFRRLRAATKREITAAGGITTIEDIRALRAMNIHAALGMAIYTGRLDLAELQRIAEGLE